MGDKIDDKFFKENKEIEKGLKSPEASREAREIYDFIVDNPYTINRGGGMGMDNIIAPDMEKLCSVAKNEDIDIYTYKNFCNEFIYAQSSHEAKQRKESEKIKK